MAYSITNPPVCIVDRIGTFPAVWIYKSADTHATVEGAGYFTDGASRGLTAHDVMIVIDTSTPALTINHVSSSTSLTAATLA